MDKPSDWVVSDPAVGLRLGKHLTQLLVENNPIAGFVHFLECVLNVQTTKFRVHSKCEYNELRLQLLLYDAINIVSICVKCCNCLWLAEVS